jgi:hypothetical protein
MTLTRQPTARPSSSAAALPAKPAVAMIESQPLTERERLYASGNRKRDNLAPKVRDAHPRSRLYAKSER